MKATFDEEGRILIGDIEAACYGYHLQEHIRYTNGLLDRVQEFTLVFHFLRQAADYHRSRWLQ